MGLSDRSVLDNCAMGRVYLESYPTLGTQLKATSESEKQQQRADKKPARVSLQKSPTHAVAAKSACVSKPRPAWTPPSAQGSVTCDLAVTHA